MAEVELCHGELDMLVDSPGGRSAGAKLPPSDSHTRRRESRNAVSGRAVTAAAVMSMGLLMSTGLT